MLKFFLIIIKVHQRIYSLLLGKCLLLFFFNNLCRYYFQTPLFLLFSLPSLASFLILSFCFCFCFCLVPKIARLQNFAIVLLFLGCLWTINTKYSHHTSDVHMHTIYTQTYELPYTHKHIPLTYTHAQLVNILPLHMMHDFNSYDFTAWDRFRLCGT